MMVKVQLESIESYKLEVDVLPNLAACRHSSVYVHGLEAVTVVVRDCFNLKLS